MPRSEKEFNEEFVDKENNGTQGDASSSEAGNSSAQEDSTQESGNANNGKTNLEGNAEESNTEETENARENDTKEDPQNDSEEEKSEDNAGYNRQQDGNNNEREKDIRPHVREWVKNTGVYRTYFEGRQNKVAGVFNILKDLFKALGIGALTVLGGAFRAIVVGDSHGFWNSAENYIKKQQMKQEFEEGRNDNNNRKKEQSQETYKEQKKEQSQETDENQKTGQSQETNKNKEEKEQNNAQNAKEPESKQSKPEKNKVIPADELMKIISPVFKSHGYVALAEGESVMIAKINNGTISDDIYKVDIRSFGYDNHVGSPESLASAIFQINNSKENVKNLTYSELDNEIMKSHIQAALLSSIASLNHENGRDLLVVNAKMNTSMGELTYSMSSKIGEDGQNTLVLNVDGKEFNINPEELNSSDVGSTAQHMVEAFRENPPTHSFSIVEREGKQIDVTFTRGNPIFRADVNIDGKIVHRGAYRAEESPAPKKNKSGAPQSLAALRRDLSNSKGSPGAAWSNWNKDIDHYTWLHPTTISYAIGAIVNPNMESKISSDPQTQGQLYSMLRAGNRGNPGYIESSAPHARIGFKNGSAIVVSNVTEKPIPVSIDNPTSFAKSIEELGRELWKYSEKDVMSDLNVMSESEKMDSLTESLIDQCQIEENPQEIKAGMELMSQYEYVEEDMEQDQYTEEVPSGERYLEENEIEVPLPSFTVFDFSDMPETKAPISEEDVDIEIE